MKFDGLVSLLVLGFICGQISAFRLESNLKATDEVYKFEYPEARRDESVVDDLHGTKVVDPYRWLEDPNSNETKQFIDAQNNFSRSYLNDNEREKIKEKLKLLYNYPKFDLPQRFGNYFFTRSNSGLQNQSVLYKQTSLNAEPEVFLDPNSLSPDGTVSLEAIYFTSDGSLMAYGLSESGSDWVRIRVRDVETGKDYPFELKKVKFSSMDWTSDSKGFFYSHFAHEKNPDGTDNRINLNQKLSYHRIDEPQEKDVLVADFPEHPSWLISTTSDGKYLIMSVIGLFKGNLVYYIDLRNHPDINGKIPLMPIITEIGFTYTYVVGLGSKLVFCTNKNAPNYRLVTIDLNNVAEENWGTLIEEDPNHVLAWAGALDFYNLIVGYLHNVQTVLQVHSMQTGKLIRKIPLEMGTVEGYSTGFNSEIFFKFQSFVTPGIIYRYNFATPEIDPTIFREIKLNLDGFNQTQFVTEQVFYPSDDGTKIPMFIVQKNTAHKGPKPTLLYGYGGFDFNLKPTFSERFVFFMNNFDGILAFANIRGGGEYGNNWYDAARLLNKQNSYTDFQAAAKYLVAQKYTEHEKIAIMGVSNGGLLVGACNNQRPELFGAVVALVGVMDMLRFHKFTVGYSWICDFGNPDEKIHFENLYNISPLHNVCKGQKYPATLIITADHDDRVPSLHSLKLAATMHYQLKNDSVQENPILLRVYSNAGHGAGKPISKQIDEDTDIFTFLYRNLKIDSEI